MDAQRHNWQWLACVFRESPHWVTWRSVHMLSEGGWVRPSEGPEARDSPLSAPDLLLCSCTFWGVQHIHPLFWLWEGLRNSSQSHRERDEEICYLGCLCLEMQAFIHGKTYKFHKEIRICPNFDKDTNLVLILSYPLLHGICISLVAFSGEGLSFQHC